MNSNVDVRRPAGQAVSHRGEELAQAAKAQAGLDAKPGAGSPKAVGGGNKKHPFGAPSVQKTNHVGPLPDFDFSSDVAIHGALAIQAPHGKYKWWIKCVPRHPLASPCPE